jgi:proteasome lid subunit RPN8/RPN11
MPTPYSIHEPELSFVSDSRGRDAPAVNASEDVLFLYKEDVTFLNRIYNERDHEIAYCGFLKNRPQDPWLADTVESSSEGTSFSTKNCPGGKPPATIHTHPSGSLALSIDDKTNIVQKDYEYMCIQAGKITTKPGRTAKRITCYAKAFFDRGYQYPAHDVVILENQ